MKENTMATGPGKSYPLGASISNGGVNFSILSKKLQRGGTSSL